MPQPFNDMFNQKSPTFRYKVRQLTVGNKTGEAYGITVPQEIASQFLNIPLRLVISGNCFMYVKDNG